MNEIGFRSFLPTHRGCINFLIKCTYFYLFTISRSEKEANYDEIVETLEKKLSNSAVENQAKGEEVNSELLRNVENERDSLKNEFDQVSFVF